MDVYLQTSPHQFGFKSKHGTELCVFAFKELLRFYTKHGSIMQVAFLDASKAFNRVNRHKLITELAQRDVPKYLLRVISNEFNNHSVWIPWDLPTRNSSLWVTVLNKEGNYLHYCLTFECTTAHKNYWL